MTGSTFKRKLPSGTIAWAYKFDAGRDPNGKRLYSFKGGFEKKGEAADALRIAMKEFEATHGKVEKHIGILGVVTWSYHFRDEKKNGFASQADADAPLAAAIERRAAAEQAAAVVDPTFKEWVQRWLDKHACRRLAPKTLERYKDFAVYLIRHLGDTPLNDLTTAQIQETVDRLKDCGGMVTTDFPEGRPLAAKTTRHIGTMLFTCLAEADRLGVLKIPHPMRDKRVRLPKLIKRDPPVVDKEKLKLLFDRARTTRLYPFVILATATGCRRGELLALEWSDLNVTTHELIVSKSLE